MIDKRITAVIVIIIAIVAFLAGVMTEEHYNTSQETELRMEYDELNDNYMSMRMMPIPHEVIYEWINNAEQRHRLYIEHDMLTEERPAEFHKDYIELYGLIRQMFLELQQKWGVIE